MPPEPDWDRSLDGKGVESSIRNNTNYRRKGIDGRPIRIGILTVVTLFMWLKGVNLLIWRVIREDYWNRRWPSCQPHDRPNGTT